VGKQSALPSLAMAKGNRQHVLESATVTGTGAKNFRSKPPDAIENAQQDHKSLKTTSTEPAQLVKRAGRQQQQNRKPPFAASGRHKVGSGNVAEGGPPPSMVPPKRSAIGSQAGTRGPPLK